MILQLQNITKLYQTKVSFFSKPTIIKAVDGVSFFVRQDTVFSLVGESGCGKSTIAKIILKLIEPTSGKVLFQGQDISSLKGKSLMSFRRSVQIIFQDPFSSLNPRMTIGKTLSEPFIIHKIIPKKMIKEAVHSLLDKVGISHDAYHKYPHEFSGGQRQRICIARALTLQPKLLIADEPLSALDVSIQAQILTLLQDIKRQSSLTILFISHDLNVVKYLSDDVAVMYAGRIMEMASAEDIFTNPLHPYTRLLLASAPKIGSKSKGNTDDNKRQGIDAEVIMGFPKEGCPFEPRCKERLEHCKSDTPSLKEIASQRFIACHLF